MIAIKSTKNLTFSIQHSSNCGRLLALLKERRPIRRAAQEGIPERPRQRPERRRPRLERLQQPPNPEIKRSVVAAVTIECSLGADGTGLEEHAGGIDVAGEAGIVKGDGVPPVAGVDVDKAGVEEVAEAVDVAGPGSLEDVAGGDLFEGDGWLEVLRVELEGVELRVDGPGSAGR